MKRLLSLILAVLLLLGCFAGCKNTEADPTETTGATQSAEIPLEDANGVEYTSLAQKAVVRTALAYLARGTRIQYDDTRFNVSDAPALYRWQYGARLSPEEYTSQNIGYSNCAAFTYDVYLAALGIKIGGYATNQLTQITGKQRIYKYFPTGKETSEEMAAVKEAFRASLQMGDIIVIRYNGDKTGGGHAMLYVGSKVLEGVEGYKGTAAEQTDESGNPKDAGYTYDIIHSTGSNYNYSKSKEVFEKYGTVQMMSVDSLFDETTGRYVFGKLESIAVIRPLATFDREIPENTLNRMRHMENIIAEKLSSHTAGMTVNPGENITYTFSVTNKNDHDVTLPVKDTVPANTTYVSSDGDCSVEGAALSWNLTVLAGETKTVSYTVKVNENAAYGDGVQSTDGSVGGVAVNCPKVFIERSLTQQEQSKLLAAVDTQLASGLRGMELANALYTHTLGGEDLLPESAGEVLDNLYLSSGEFYLLRHTDSQIDMLAPGMFGGRYVIQGSSTLKTLRHELNRTRLPYPDQLMVGDLLVINEEKLYLFTGEGMLDLVSGEQMDANSCLMPILSYKRFAILRPSMILGKDQ